jgi:hypothetical protein
MIFHRRVNNCVILRSRSEFFSMTEFYDVWDCELEMRCYIYILIITHAPDLLYI